MSGSASLVVLINVRLRMDTVENANTKPVHRLEVFTGAGRRRTWSDEEKTRIVAEIEAGGHQNLPMLSANGIM